ASGRHPRSTLSAYPTLFRSGLYEDVHRRGLIDELGNARFARSLVEAAAQARDVRVVGAGGTPTTEDLVTTTTADVTKAFEELTRSEEHTSELQSREKLVCRL